MPVAYGYWTGHQLNTNIIYQLSGPSQLTGLDWSTETLEIWTGQLDHWILLPPPATAAVSRHPKNVLFVVFTPGPLWHHRAKISRVEGI